MYTLYLPQGPHVKQFILMRLLCINKLLLLLLLLLLYHNYKCFNIKVAFDYCIISCHHYKLALHIILYWIFRNSFCGLVNLISELSDRYLNIPDPQVNLVTILKYKKGMYYYFV